MESTSSLTGALTTESADSKFFEETVRENQESEDFFAGLMFVVVGVAFAWGATTYSVGSGARMGPGYFPLMLGILLAILGVDRDVRRRSRSRPRTASRSAASPGSRWSSSSAPTSCSAFCSAACPASGMPAMGLIVAIYALVLIASLAGDEFQRASQR